MGTLAELDFCNGLARGLRDIGKVLRTQLEFLLLIL